MTDTIKIHMELEEEKKYSIKFKAIDPSAAMQNAYINRKDLPNAIPNDIMITIDFVDWEYILGHMIKPNNQNRKNR